MEYVNRLMKKVYMCPCNTVRSFFKKRSLSDISALQPPHAMEEYEVLKEQPKSDIKIVDDPNEEKWMREFESWDKTKKEEKKQNLIGLDVETIMKEQNNVDEKAAEIFQEMNMAPIINNNKPKEQKKAKEYITQYNK